jgi:transposase
MACWCKQDAGASPFFPPRHDSIETAAPEIQGILHRSPRLYELPYTGWTLERLRAVLSVYWNCSDRPLISLPGLCKLLKRLHVRFKRGRASLHSPDLAYDAKMAAIRAAIRQSQADPVRHRVLFQDEMGYERRPRVGMSYGGCGQRGRPARQTPGVNQQQRIATCLDTHTGALHSWQRRWFIVPELFKFLRHVEHQYPDAETITIVWDNWSVHLHPSLVTRLAECHSRIRFLQLPTYAPWENPSEKVWLLLRKEVLNQHEFGDDWEGLKQAVAQWLERKRHGSMDLLRFVGLLPSQAIVPLIC